MGYIFMREAEEKRSPIQCELTLGYLGTGDSHATEKYDAISYYWGLPSSPDRELSCTIQLDGEAFPVSPVVRDVLRDLRTDEDRLLWIDFICIDQNNKAEKVFQIARMRDIYAQAESTVICFTDVDQMREARRRYHRADDASPFGPFEWDGLLTFREHRRLPPYIVTHPWFDRIWVVQEVFHARTVSVRYKDTEVTGEEFASRVTRVKEILKGKRILQQDWYANVQPLLEAMSGGSDGRQVPLIDLLHTYRAREASLGVDKVFALLSMCSDDVRSPELEVNYGFSPKDVYFNVAWSMIWHTGTLDIMTYRSRLQVAKTRADVDHRAAVKRSTGGLGTWFPYWNDKDSSIASTRSIAQISGPFAPRGEHLPLSFASFPGLSVSGYCIGEVTSVFADGTVEAVPNPKITADIRRVWDWKEISLKLKGISLHLGSRRTPGLAKGDRLWILLGSSGLAILRDDHPRSGKVLITMEHSDFPRFGEHRTGASKLQSVSSAHRKALDDAAAMPGSTSLERIAAVIARARPTVFELY